MRCRLQYRKEIVLRKEAMDRDRNSLIQATIAQWSGIACPNEAANLGLNDFPGLMKELAALGPTMVFEDEPSSFEAALLAEKEPSK